MTERAPRIGFVVGERSGDVLGAEIATAIHRERPDTTFHGVGGEALQSLGLRTLFDPDEIAIVGITAVLAKLPRLIRLIERTARDLAEANLDAAILIDAPDFTHRVARRLRDARPELPIVKVVAPTVWAWRPERAAALKPIVDEVLAIFPHEPDVMERLGGPPTTFIGHPLMAKDWSRPERANDRPNLLVLLGSRRTEIERLASPFAETVAILRDRIGELRVSVPTTERRADMVRDIVAKWPFEAEVVVGDAAKQVALLSANAALAASGTVTLELALADVPSVVAYKVDAIERIVAKRITSWAMAMPNIIADRVVMDEAVTEMVRPPRMARLLERLLTNTPERQTQLEGFALVRERLATARPPAELAAERILSLID